MCRRGAGCPLPAIDAGCGALARPEANRPLRFDERYEARCADRPGHRNRRTCPDSRRSCARRRPCGNCGKESRRLLHVRAAARPDRRGRPFARKILRGTPVSLVNLETSAALSLLNAGAVRERAHRILAIGLEDKLPNFRIHLDRMDSTVDLVLRITREAYPWFDVPFHWHWPASKCSPAAHSRLIPLSPCGSMPTYLQISPSRTSSAACRSRMSIRCSALTAALTCCAASAGWRPRSRTYSEATTRHGPAACSIDLRCWRTTNSFPPRPF